jgi:hypothetical protein
MIDRDAIECQKIIRQRGVAPGRHHLGTLGEIISECPGDFVGIRTRSPAGELMTLGGVRQEAGKE